MEPQGLVEKEEKEDRVIAIQQPRAPETTKRPFGTLIGGFRGPNGAPGRRKSNCILQPGSQGSPGRFMIHVQEKQYKNRYELVLQKTSFRSKEMLHRSNLVFQFGDCVSISNMTCRNTGGMISPSQKTRVEIRDLSHNSHILVCKDDTNSNNAAHVHQRVEKGDSGAISGTILFRVKAPDIGHLPLDDVPPFRVEERLYLQATQLGPTGYGFERIYSNFDRMGTLLNFRFPVENESGLQGLSTICAGAGMYVTFRITNTSLRDLGINSRDQRQLYVHFFRNGRGEYDVASRHVDFSMDGVECNSKLDCTHNNAHATGSDVWKGTRLPVQFLGSGQTKTFRGKLRLSPQVAPYSRFAVQAEIVLQDLPHDNNMEEGLSINPSRKETLPFSVIQRRRLEITAEPSFVPTVGSQVVLVTSAATTKEQFIAWDNLLNIQLGLQVDYYSVSIYGSLDPNFRLPDYGSTLSPVFKGKLIVVLDDTFQPEGNNVSKMTPSEMLPNGCQPQSSGFDRTTRWLLVGSSYNAIQQALLAHYTAPAHDVSYYSSCKKFKQGWLEQLREERSQGNASDERIREVAIRVRKPNNKRLKDKATAMKTFLEKEDPLRQYIVEPRSELLQDKGGRYQLIIVRRGYSRTANAVNVCCPATKRVPCHGDNTWALFALIQSLPYETLQRVFFHAVANANESYDLMLVQNICLDVFTQELLWDVENFLNGKFTVLNANSQAKNNAFISLADLSKSNAIHELLTTDTKESRIALSRLLGRLKCVARSRDLNLWWWPCSSQDGVRKSLNDMIGQLERVWSSAVVPAEICKEIQDCEREIVQFLRQTYGLCSFHRFQRRWSKALYHICSDRNDQKYGKSESSLATHRLCD